MTVISLHDVRLQQRTAQEMQTALAGGKEAVDQLVAKRREFLAAVELAATWLERYSALQEALHQRLTGMPPIEGVRLLNLLNQHPGLTQWADELKELVERFQ